MVETTGLEPTPLRDVDLQICRNMFDARNHCATAAQNFIYKVHNPVGLKYLTRLRMGLSHLKSHKFLHNFNDTLDQYCGCDKKSIESTGHYLLFCPIFCHTRDQLFTDIQNEISVTACDKTFVTQLLLYRNESSSVSTGNFILQWSINYSYIGMNPLVFLLATLFYNGQ